MIGGVVAPTASFLLTAAAAMVWLSLSVAWCLFVLLLTGRLPWFVRRHF